MSDSIAITSGKGGVGKTTFAVNLSIAQRKFTDQVFLLDTDMGMANSHVLLGINPKYSISDVISGEKKISEIIENYKKGIDLISGGTASNNLLNLENVKRYSILNEIDNHLKTFTNVKQNGGENLFGKSCRAGRALRGHGQLLEGRHRPEGW